MLIISIAILQVACANEEVQVEQVWIIFLMLYGLFILTGIIIIGLYTHSYKKYKKMISLFNREELERINREAKAVYNMGKLLITNDVIIYFGFCKKEVVPTNIIEKVIKEEGTYKSGRVTLDYHNILLECTDNKRVIVYAPKNYNGVEYENCVKIIKHVIKNKQLNKILNKEDNIDINSLAEANIFKDYKEFRMASIMQVLVAITYLLVCFIINNIIEFYMTRGLGSILKTVYSIGFKEFLAFVELVIYTIIFVAISVYYKFNNKNVVKGNIVTKGFSYAIFLILILFIRIFRDTANYDYEKEARSDYLSYLKDECKTYKGKISNDTGGSYHGIPLTSYKAYYNGQVIDLFGDTQVFGSIEGSVDENKVYKITYLPKTHLIISISEEDD